MRSVRLRIDLAYDGGDFHGWAAQPGLRTVQGELEAALATVLRVPSVSVTCAGRTDTGVHARGQVVHLDVAEGAVVAAAGRYDGEPAGALERRLNGLLPADLRVRRVTEAPAGFDARFSPLWRRYAYRLCDGVADPLTRGHVLTWPRPLDVAAMDEASAGLVGLHDFAAFCKQREGATTVRTLLELRWVREGHVLTGIVRADAFCHHMVRSLVGALLAVGEGRRPVAWPAEVLRAGDRDAAVTVVPAHGLTLEEVGYPDDAALADRAEESRAKREPV
jgi:tRNA pseudouridine38-40 synthase